jgi:hypothetical protein
MSDPGERVLTERELNRALLQRQMLLSRAKSSLPKAAERVGTLQAQYAPSMYVGLWSRLEGFERETLTRALERRNVVQGTMMRVTIHLASKGDYWPLVLAIRKARRELWLNATHRRGISRKEIVAMAKRLRRRLSGGTMTRKEIDEFIGKDSVWTNGMNVFLDLVRVPPSGTWERRRADRFALAEDWIGPAEVDRTDAVELLVRRYLAGYGPGTRTEIADWAGVPAATIDPALERLRLRRFRSEAGEELLDLPRAPLPDPETPAPPRFLPTWDATLLVHTRRTQILREEDRPRVFSPKTPQSVPTFTVDGHVAGTWRYEKGKVKLSPFRRLDATSRRELDREAEGLAELHA